MNDARTGQGFTLVEVLVALAVVALVLVALLGSMQAVVASATTIQDRTVANWIAVDKVTEFRLGAQFPAAGRDSGEVEMAGLLWVYSVNIENVSASGDILTVTVKVSMVNEPEISLGIASGTLIRPANSTGQPLRPGSNAGRINGVAPSVGYGRAGVGNFSSGGDGSGAPNLPQDNTTEGETE